MLKFFNFGLFKHYYLLKLNIPRNPSRCTTHVFTIYTSWIQFHSCVRIRKDVRKQRTFLTHLFADHLDTVSPLDTNILYLTLNNILTFLKIPSMVLCCLLSFNFLATWAAAISHIRPPGSRSLTRGTWPLAPSFRLAESWWTVSETMELCNDGQWGSLSAR